MEVTIPQEITDGYAQHGILVEIVPMEGGKVGHFAVKTKEWSETIASLDGLYNFLAGFNRGIKT